MSEEQTTAKTPRQRVTSRWVRIATFGSIAFTALIAAFYLLHIRDRQLVLDEYHLRTLSQAASNSSQRMIGLQGQLESALDGVLEDVDGELVQAPGESSAADSTDADPGDVSQGPLSFQAALSTRLGLIDALENDEWIPSDRQREQAVDAPRTPVNHGLELAASLTHGVEPAIEFTFWYDVGEFSEDTGTDTAVGNDDDDTLAGKKAGAEDEPPTRETELLEWRATSALSDLLGKTLPDDVFETVVLARADGEIMLQRGGESVRLNRLELPPPADGPPPASIDAVTGVSEVDIAGRPYRVFSHPISLPIPLLSPQAADGSNGGRESTWILAGLRAAGEFRKESLVVSSTLVVVLCFLMSLAFLYLPVLRLFAVGPRDDVRSNDVLVLVVSMVLALSVTAFGLMDLATYLSMREEFDDSLETLAQQIDDAALEEVRLLSEQIDLLTETLIASEEETNQKELGFLPRQTRLLTNTLCASEEETNQEKSGFLCASHGENHVELEARPDIVDPFFEMSFWYDDEGQQKAKWSIRESTTTLGSYPGRAYFQRARDADLWEMPWPSRDGSLRDNLFIESIRSKTQGLVFAVLSKPMAHETYRVAAIESAMLSLIGPSLPTGYRFAVVGEDGQVLFHSNPERNLEEDLFRELDPDGRLAAAVFARSSDTFDATYRAGEVRAHVRPMSVSPEWTLVVLGDKLGPRSFHLEVLLLGFLLFGGLLVFLGLIAVWMAWSSRVTPRRGTVRSAWYWPSPRRLGVYRRLGASLGLLFATAALALWKVDDGGSLLCAGFAIPSFALAGFRVAHSHDRAPSSSGFAWFGCVSLAIVAFLALTRMGIGPPIHTEPATLPLTALAVVAFLACRRVDLAFLLAAVVCGASLATAAAWVWAVGSVMLAFSVLLAFLARHVHEQQVDEGKAARARAAARTKPSVAARWKGAVSWGREEPRALARERWHRRCAIAIGLAVVCLSVLPAWLFYKAAFLEVAPVVAQRRALQFAQVLEARATALRDRYGSIAMTEQIADTTLEMLRLPETEEDDTGRGGRGPTEPLVPRDVYTAGLYDVTETRNPTSDGGTTPRLHLMSLLPAYGPLSHLNRAVSRIEGRRVAGIVEGRETAPETRLANAKDEAWDASPTHVSLLVDRYRPELQLHVQEQEQDDAPEELASGEDATARERAEARPRGAAGPGPDDDAQPAERVEVLQLRVESHVPQLTIDGFTMLFLTLFVAALIVYGTSRGVLSRLFFLGRLEAEFIDGQVIGDGHGEKRRLYLRPAAETIGNITASGDVAEITLSDLRGEKPIETIWERVKAKADPRVVLRQFEEELHDEKTRHLKLELVELLNDKKVARIDIVANIDPLYVLTTLRKESPDACDESEFARWSEFLEPFVKIRTASRERNRDRALPAYRARLAPLEPDPNRVDAIAQECWPTGRLRDIGVQLIKSDECRDLTDDEITDAVLDLAEAHYARIWSECIREERLALYRLARGSWANWRARNTLLRLRRRTLVQATPSFHLMNESFRRFVLDAETARTFDEWAQHGDKSVWTRLRTPLLVSFLFVAGLFFVTQRQAFNQALGALVALAAGAPTLIRLAGLVTQGRPSAQGRP